MAYTSMTRVSSFENGRNEKNNVFLVAVVSLMTYNSSSLIHCSELAFPVVNIYL